MTIALRAAQGSFSNAGTTITMTVPAGVVNGDVMLMSVTVASPTTPTLPAGWTLLNSTATTPASLLCSRIANNEPASYAVTIPSVKAAGEIIAFSGENPRAFLAAQSALQRNAASLTVTAPALGTWDPVAGAAVFFGAMAGQTTLPTPAPPTNYTEPANGQASSSASSSITAEVAYRLFSVPQSTVGSITATWTGTAAANVGASVYVFEAEVIRPYAVQRRVPRLPTRRGDRWDAPVPVQVAAPAVFVPAYTVQHRLAPRLPTRRAASWQAPIAQGTQPAPAYLAYEWTRPQRRPVVRARRAASWQAPIAQGEITPLIRTYTVQHRHIPRLPTRRATRWGPVDFIVGSLTLYPPETVQRRIPPRLPTRRGARWSPGVIAQGEITPVIRNYTVQHRMSPRLPLRRGTHWDAPASVQAPAPAAFIPPYTVPRRVPPRPSARRVRRAELTPFSPLSIPGLFGWWDPSDVSTVTQAGGLVSQINDKSGNAFHISATGTARPTWGAEIGGLPAVEYDGGARMLKNAGPVTRTQPITYFVVSRHNPGAVTNTFDNMVGGPATPPNPTLYVRQSNASWGSYAGTLVDDGVANRRSHVFSALFDNTAASGLNIDGVSVVTGASGGFDFNAGAIEIGGQDTGNNWTGQIGEILFYSGTLTAGQRAVVEQYLIAKWLGVTLPAPSYTVQHRLAPRLPTRRAASWQAPIAQGVQPAPAYLTYEWTRPQRRPAVRARRAASWQAPIAQGEITPVIPPYTVQHRLVPRTPTRRGRAWEIVSVPPTTTPTVTPPYAVQHRQIPRLPTRRGTRWDAPLQQGLITPVVPSFVQRRRAHVFPTRRAGHYGELVLAPAAPTRLIKTINGLPIAQVKTKNDLPIAQMKALNDLP